MTKKIDINTLLERIENLEARLDKLDPISKRKKIKLMTLKTILKSGLKNFHP